MPLPLMQKKLKSNNSMESQDLLGLTPNKRMSFSSQREWNAKVGSQEIPGVTGKFGLGVQNESGQRPKEFCVVLPTIQEMTLHMDITRWSTLKSNWLFYLKPKTDTLQSQQKQDQELIVAQIMNPY